MKTETRFQRRTVRPAASSIAAAIIVSIGVGLAGCGQQAAPPAQTGAAVAPPTAPVALQQPGQAPTAVQMQPTPVQVQPGAVPVQRAPVQGQQGMMPSQPVPVQPQPGTYAAAPVAPSGRPVPNAPADDPNPPVAYAPVQAAPPVARAPARAAAHESRPVASHRLGRVASIEPIREKPSGTGAGGVLGGVLGAVVGNQFGHGNGRAAMTVIGAAGGAVAGNTVERNVRERIVGYRVSVDLDNGDVRSYQQTNPGDLQVGDRVRVDGQRLRRL